MSSIFEIISISILIPLLNNFFNEPNSKLSFNFFGIENLFNSMSNKSLVIIFIIVYVVKILYLIVNVFFQNYLNQTFVNSLVNKLAFVYVNQNIDFHSKNSPSFLFKNLRTETAYAGQIFSSITMIMSDLILIITVSACLLVINYKILILSFLVILPFSLIYISIAKKTNRDFSSIRNEVDKDINRHIFENFTGIKELIYFQNKEFFTRKIYKNLNLQRRYNSYTYTLSQSTKYYIEFILIIILAAVYSYYLLIGIQLAQLFSSLAVFLMASVRILPIIARIQGNFQTYDFYKSSIELIAKDLSFYKLNRENEICFENFESIEGHNLSFKYGKKIIFEDFNFKITKDLITIIHGPSGNGKSTLLDLISGNRKFISGNLIINNIDISNKSFRFNRIAFMSQKPFVFRGSISDNICFGREYNYNHLKNAIKESGVSKFITSNDYENLMIEENGSNYSVGQIQRITLARSLYGKPSLIIMDEPTSAIDNKNVESFINTIESLSLKIKIIIVTHDNSIIERFRNHELIKMN